MYCGFLCATGLLVSANLWYMYAVAHVHLPGEIVLSEEVWNEAFLGKVYVCDEKKMTYFGFSTEITREFNREDFQSTYYVKGSTFSSKKITKDMVAGDTQDRSLVLEDGAYLYNGHWRLHRRSGIFFPEYEYSAFIGYQKDYMYVGIQITCNDPRKPELQELLTDIVAYINTNTAQ